MLTRDQVFEIINDERAYQDREYRPDEFVSSGLTRRTRDAEVSPGILMLEAYARKATDAWVNTKGSNTPALREVAKIAAIAVRILERAGDSQVLLEVGLRDKK